MDEKIKKLTISKYKEIKRNYELNDLKEECFKVTTTKELAEKCNRYNDNIKYNNTYPIQPVWLGAGIYSILIKNKHVVSRPLEWLIMSELKIDKYCLKIFTDRDGFINDELKKSDSKHIHVSFVNNKVNNIYYCCEVKQKYSVQKSNHQGKMTTLECKDLNELNEEELLEYYKLSFRERVMEEQA
jgi:hypothetical protein